MSARTATPGRWTLETVPRLLVECRVQAAAYGRCVSADSTGKTELRKGACAKEFEELKQCISKALRVCCNVRHMNQTHEPYKSYLDRNNVSEQEIRKQGFKGEAQHEVTERSLPRSHCSPDASTRATPRSMDQCRLPPITSHPDPPS